MITSTQDQLMFTACNVNVLVNYSILCAINGKCLKLEE